MCDKRVHIHIVQGKITDHTHNKNPFFPAWPHAREYGLFALNNLGGKTMDKTSESPKIVLKPKQKIVFKHKLIIGGNLKDDQIEYMKKDFWAR